MPWEPDAETTLAIRSESHQKFDLFNKAPLERTEDGLSKVEIRLFNEVIAGGLNNKYKKIVISAKLTPLLDAEVIELINKS